MGRGPLLLAGSAPRRQWVAGVLRDIEEGTCSVLEHGYLARVERPHELPRGRRQVADVGKSGRIYRDVAYRMPLVVELDGRLSWGQVFDRPCWTASQVGVLLQQRGWTGSPTSCGAACGLSG